MIQINRRGMNKLLLFLILGLFLLSSCQRNEGQRMFSTALTLWKSSNYDEAIQNFIALTKAFPEHELVDDSLFWIANIYEHYLREPEQGIRYYRSLTRKFDQSEYKNRSMIGLARIYGSKGNEGKQKAILIYEKLQKKFLPENEWIKNQFHLAQLYLQSKQFSSSRTALKTLITKYPKSDHTAKAFHKIGLSYYQEGKYALAEVTYKQTEKQYDYSNASLPSAVSLADMYEELDQLQSAIDIYRSILKRLDKNEMYYQLATNRIHKLKIRLRKTNTG